MRFVTPKIYFVGSTQIHRPMLERYLEDQGVTDWQLPIGVSDGELLTEFYGRLCYASFGATLNDNITKIRPNTAQYIHNLVESQHGSVLEHVQCNFIFSNVSRVFTHELVRHRPGVAISQESMRYVRTDEIDVWVPKIMDTPVIRAMIQEKLERDEQWARDISDGLGIDQMPFEKKKEATSALRRFASPQGVATEIGWSCNLRGLRYIIDQRTHPSAEEEIRRVFDQVANVITYKYPIVFADFVRENGHWQPKWRKV